MPSLCAHCRGRWRETNTLKRPQLWGKTVPSWSDELRSEQSRFRGSGFPHLVPYISDSLLLGYPGPHRSWDLPQSVPHPRLQSWRCPLRLQWLSTIKKWMVNCSFPSTPHGDDWKLPGSWGPWVAEPVNNIEHQLGNQQLFHTAPMASPAQHSGQKGLTSLEKPKMINARHKLLLWPETSGHSACVGWALSMQTVFDHWPFCTQCPKWFW